MFWKSVYMPSKINTLLEKEDVMLTEILFEEDVVDECKSGNTKLIDFLTKDETIDTIVSMMVDEPPSELDDREKYKNAHIACEVLTSDVAQITDALSNRDEVLKKIYSFFEGEAPLNPLQASFFSKTMGLLITHKSEKILTFLKSRSDFTRRLVSHIDVSAIADLLLRLVTCIDSVECRNQCFQWLNEQQLVGRLVSLIDISHSPEVHSNASQSICDIVRLSREHLFQYGQQQYAENGSAKPVAPDDVLLRAIESTETIEKLLDKALPQDSDLTNESLITSTITVLQTLLEPRRPSTFVFSISEDAILCNNSERLEEADPDSDKKAENKTNNNNESLDRIVSVVVARLDDFFRILSDPPKQRYNPMPSTHGLLNPPLGPTRLAVVRFFNVLLSLKSCRQPEEKLAEIGAPSKIMNLFFDYPFNNFLHGEVEKFIYHATSSSSEQRPLLYKLLKEYNLVDKICQELEIHFKPKDENNPQETRPRRPGYLGHLTSVANLLSSKFDSSPELFQALPEDTQSRWTAFVTDVLEGINKVNTTDLGVSINNGRGLLTSSEDDDDDDDDFKSLLFPDDALQKAFANYQLQDVNTNFVDNFGFTEDDFIETDEAFGSQLQNRISSLDLNLESIEDNPMAAATFQQACQDRIQQFDESDEGDEDEWASYGQQMSRFYQPARSSCKNPKLNNESRTASTSSFVVRDVDNSDATDGAGDGIGNEEGFEDGYYDDDSDDGSEPLSGSGRFHGEKDGDDDSEDDLDSPAVIHQRKVHRSEPFDGIHVDYENGNNDDDDYESLHDDGNSTMDATFMADDSGEGGNSSAEADGSANDSCGLLNDSKGEEAKANSEANGLSFSIAASVENNGTAVTSEGNAPVEPVTAATSESGGGGDAFSLLDHVASKFGLLSPKENSDATTTTTATSVASGNSLGSAVDLEDT